MWSNEKTELPDHCGCCTINPETEGLVSVGSVVSTGYCVVMTRITTV